MAFKIGKNCQIDPTAIINVKEGFLGDRTIVRGNVRIEGRCVEIGNESFLDYGAMIGGGSCFDSQARLKAGDWLHMGLNSQINIARGVEIGHEFGCGIETKIFTHGAYLDSYNLGAPNQWKGVKIGNQVWMPNAWVNPGVEIGDHVVIAARSLINKNLPSGCLAGGCPAEVLNYNYLPRALSENDKISLINEIKDIAIKRFVEEKDTNSDNFEINVELDKVSIKYKGKSTQFHLQLKTIEGNEIEISHFLKDQLRRNGIRFRYLFDEGEWRKWE